MRQRRLSTETKTLGTFNNVCMTQEEIDLLKDFYPSYWIQYVEKLSAHKESTGKEYASDYATLKMWLTEDIGSLEEV